MNQIASGYWPNSGAILFELIAVGRYSTQRKERSVLQADAMIEPNFQRLHLAVGGEHDVDIPNRVPGRLPEFASLGDEVLLARGAVDKPQPCEDPLDHAVRLQNWHSDVGEKVVARDVRAL